MVYSAGMCFTILDKDLGASEASMDSSHMQRALPFLALSRNSGGHYTIEQWFLAFLFEYCSSKDIFESLA